MRRSATALIMRFRARALAAPEGREQCSHEAGRGRDLLGRAGAAEEVAEVRARRPSGLAHDLAEGGGGAPGARVGVGEVVGRQALAVAVGLPAAGGAVDGGGLVEHRKDLFGERAPGEHGVAHALAGDRVLEVPGVAGERPSGAR